MTDPVARIRAAEWEPEAERSAIFLNAASSGILPLAAARAAADLTLRRSRAEGVRDEELVSGLRRARDAVAALLEVDVSEVTLTPNTSFGINLGVALAAAGPPGTVILPQGEFPANVYPWMALRERGFRVEVVPGDALGRPDADRLMERLHRDDVRVLALSAVQFATGYLADLAAFGRVCRERGVLFVVDAIQALGAVPIHPREVDIDVLASGGQKWLCSPWGSGFAWIHPRHRERFAPPMVSWLSMEAALDFTDLLSYRWGFVDDGRKFELATLGIQDHLALAHAVELFVEMGEAASQYIRSLQEPLLRWIDGREDVRLVTPREEAHRAGIVAFTPDDLEGAAEGLREGGVVFAVREGAIRLAPHVYNTVDEMERVMEILIGTTRTTRQ